MDDSYSDDGQFDDDVWVDEGADVPQMYEQPTPQYINNNAPKPPPIFPKPVVLSMSPPPPSEPAPLLPRVSCPSEQAPSLPLRTPNNRSRIKNIANFLDSKQIFSPSTPAPKDAKLNGLNGEQKSKSLEKNLTLEQVRKGSLQVIPKIAPKPAVLSKSKSEPRVNKQFRLPQPTTVNLLANVQTGVHVNVHTDIRADLQTSVHSDVHENPPPVPRRNVTHGYMKSVAVVPPTARNEQPVSLSEVFLDKFPWYHGKMDRQTAENKLAGIHVNGCFLIRERITNIRSHPMAVSLVFNDKVYHLEIRIVDGGKYAVGCGPKEGEMTFGGVDYLVNYYRDNPLHLISRNTATNTHSISCSTLLTQFLPKN